MPANQIVQARVNKQTKEEAAVVLESIGLTLSDAVRLLLTRIAKEKKLPFEPLIPNETTIKAMKESRRKAKRFNSIDSLMDDLHADD